MTASVPYYGMHLRTAPDREAIKASLREVAASDEFILKRRVAAFEEQLCEFTGVGHAVAVSSGTAAVQLALQALGIGPGDEVIVPAFGFHSSASCVARLGARPVLVDVREDTWLIDPGAAAAAITKRSAGIVPVHLFSAMADMPALRTLAERHDLRLLENSAVAIGMSLDGRAAGRHGDAGLFSFQPVKPVGGLSDGGAVVSDDPEVARKVRWLRNHGQDGVTRFTHHEVGYNARMDEVNAALLARRLARYPAAIARRAEIAARYDAAFAGLAPDLRLPPAVEHERVVYTYVVASGRRDQLERHLGDAGIETVVYYPRPLHLQPGFAFLGLREGELPVAEQACRESLALPLYPDMPDGHVDAVIEAVRGFHGA